MHSSLENSGEFESHEIKNCIVERSTETSCYMRFN
jgi:hypothetical protein